MLTIDEQVYKKMPPHLQAMFDMLPNPGSEEVAALFPETESGANKLGSLQGRGKSGVYSDYEGFAGNEYNSNSGSASRFFYCAKASQAERGHGNSHPTVKPLALIKYLINLITPPGGLVLDPFMGSGTTLRAAQELGFRAVGIDLSEDYCQIAVERLRQPTFYSLPSMATKKIEYQQNKLF